MKGWGAAAFVGIGAAIGLIGLMYLKGKFDVDKLKEIRNALRFASDAQVPRVQAEAMLALADVGERVLLEMQREAAEGRQACRDVDAGIASATKHNDEVRAVVEEIRDLLKPTAKRARKARK